MTGTSGRSEPKFRLTGPKVLAILVAFFLAIFAANAALIYLALDSWPGLDTETAYTEGLVYDQEIEAARAQEERAWKVEAVIGREATGAAIVRIELHDKDGHAVNGMTVTADFDRPTDTADDMKMTFVEKEPGTYLGQLADVPTGAWTLVINVVDPAGERVYRSRNRVVLH
ncbi:MAG: FixH family protein [Hyphomicrobiales bacterium]